MNIPTRCIELTRPEGDRASVALFGAQLLSWRTADGVERLYLSPNAVFDGLTPIRGGVPICFPQFNMRGPLPKHGIARALPWQLDPAHERSDASVRLSLRDSDATRRWWPQAFAASLTVTLAPNRLRLAFEVVNTDHVPWAFTFALHGYLRVAAIAQTRLLGLRGQRYWDALADREARQQEEELGFDAPTDRVYGPLSTGTQLELREPRGQLRLTQSDTLSEAVVWNPGQQLSAAIADLPADGWRSMLCVEAAKVDAPVVLAPDQRWQAWQQFDVAA